MRNENCEYENDGKRITQPGKFEGEPVWVPEFWQAGLEGMADEDDGSRLTFRLSNSDRAKWPMLVGIVHVELREDENGFVHSHTY